MAKRTFAKMQSTSIESDDEFFKGKLDLVDYKLYLPPAQVDEDALLKNKFHRNKHNKAPKQSVKEAVASKKAEKKRKKFGQDNVGNADRLAQVSNQENVVTSSSFAPPKSQPAKSIEELKERLAKRLAQFKEKRASESHGGGKRKKVSVARQQKKAPPLDKTPLVKKYGSEELLRKSVADNIYNSYSANNLVDDDDDNDGSSKTTSAKTGSYSKSTTRTQMGKNNPINVKNMLKKAQQTREMIEQLKKSQNPDDVQKAQDLEWSKLERKAVGERVPEPKHIKKQLKKIEKKKEKSAQAWAQRTSALQDEKTARYDKRDANIKKRQDIKIANKLKRKGFHSDQQQQQQQQKRKRPGFEGARTKFLNDA